MKKFEYKHLFLDINDFSEHGNVISYLNKFGNNGWELVSIVDGIDTSNKKFKNFFLKRPLKIVKNEKT